MQIFFDPIGVCGFVTLCVALDAFAAKALRLEAFCFTSFYWNRKGAKLRFGLVFVSRKDTKTLNFLLLLMLSVSLMPVLKTDAPSPDSNENPFVPGFGTKDCSG